MFSSVTEIEQPERVAPFRRFWTKASKEVTRAELLTPVRGFWKYRPKQISKLQQRPADMPYWRHNARARHTLFYHQENPVGEWQVPSVVFLWMF